MKNGIPAKKRAVKPNERLFFQGPDINRSHFLPHPVYLSFPLFRLFLLTSARFCSRSFLFAARFPIFSRLFYAIISNQKR